MAGGHGDPRREAGKAAERQMRFYLNRAFPEGNAVRVINDLRLVDPEQPEFNEADGVCQIDHLIVHRRGMFIVESKSVHDEVVVRSDGTGGDEWTRRFGRTSQGFPSPIRQAERQAKFLRTLLDRERECLLGKVIPGMRLAMKLVAGTDQRSFRKMPIQIIVAISDNGKISRAGGWKEPTDPFRTFVCKADQVESKVLSELKRHGIGGKLLGPTEDTYGVWTMTDGEVERVVAFLQERNTASRPQHPMMQPPAPGRPDIDRSAPANPASPACKSCHGASLTALSGPYGYYWKCADCGVNTAMPTVCSVCGSVGERGRGVRIRKDGPVFLRACESCSIEERIWTER